MVAGSVLCGVTVEAASCVLGRLAAAPPRPPRADRAALGLGGIATRSSAQGEEAC